MASCSKVLSVTTVAAILYEQGILDLYMPVADPRLLGPEFAQNGKEDIRVLNLLLHNAGFAPDPVPFFNTAEFNCPNTEMYHPALNFSCMPQIYPAILAQKLINPVNHVYVYSDLSFMTLMLVTGKLVIEEKLIHVSSYLPACFPAVEHDVSVSYICAFEAFFRDIVVNSKQLHLSNTGFLPNVSAFASMSAPTENDTVYMHQVIQGVVSDGNAYAMGGIGGHAGLFSTATDTARIALSWMENAAEEVRLLSPATIALFTKEFNHTQSSRALGWNTNDPTVVDSGWGQSCGNMTAVTYMHIGYTGTEVCIDPVREYYTVFLTNRVYPTYLNDRMNQARREFNDAVLAVMVKEDAA